MTDFIAVVTIARWCAIQIATYHAGVTILQVLSLFINISTLIREKYDTHDIDEAHYRNFLKDAYNCSCMLRRFAEMYDDGDIQ